MQENCPQCNKSSKSPSSRLVQDFCGHKKCRICLLQDESECRLCIQQSANNRDHVVESERGVIKFENNHTAVITCNKLKDFGRSCVTNKLNESNHKTKSKVLSKTKSESDEQKRSYKFISIPSHVSVVTGNPVMYKCNICNKCFRTKSHVKYHSFCREGKKPLHCNDCNKEFISKYHLETHQLGHVEDKKYVCDVCNKSFTRCGKLNRHKIIHSNTKQHICQQCGKVFKSKDYLQRHCLIHNIEKPFSCNQCNAKFNNRSNLNKHRGIHSKEKCHMCDECGKRFKFKNTLNIHRRSHTRLRPHKCTECLKSFINAKELQRHRLIHSDIKAYVCSLCGISFQRKDNLQRHIRNTHPGKKATVIKKPNEPVEIKSIECEVPTENPNAIKVITAPPVPVTPTKKSEPILSKPVPVINAPLKLAFKTTAFKSHYNIHSREYIEPPRIHPKPYDYTESVNICKKILSPSSPPPQRTIIKTLGNVSEQESTEICQKILSPIIPPVINNDVPFEKSQSIRNIKFKLPSKYINLSKRNIFNDINELKPVENLLVSENSSDTKTYTELKPMPPTNVATSVIVNTFQNEIHWRRRKLQNLEMQSKHTDIDGPLL